MKETIQKIRKRLYLAMDGVNSSAMRKKGVEYKLIFGTPIMTLRKMAKDYAPDASLANALWKEDVRELKILATMIQNPQTFAEAETWIEEIDNLELAEQISMNLLNKLPNAGTRAGHWIQSDRLYTQVCGYLVYTRLFSQNYSLSAEESDNYFLSLFEALNSESLLLKNAALNSLKRLGRQSPLLSRDILARCKESAVLKDDEKNNLFHNLEFEFDYYS